MPLKEDISAKIAADREAGRDIPPVIEELFLMISNFLEPEEKQPETENLGAAPVEQKPAEPVTQE